MIYIANAMTPFSPKDVTIYSNCDEVRLTYCKGGKEYTYHKPANEAGMPSPVITFKDVFDVMYDKKLSRQKKQADSYLLAEGLMDGKVVATHKVTPTRRPSKLLLWADDEKVQMKADGSDIVTVIAAIADENGNIKRLNNYEIKFEIEGQGQLVADEETFQSTSGTLGNCSGAGKIYHHTGRNQNPRIGGMARQTYAGSGRTDYSYFSFGTYAGSRQRRTDTSTIRKQRCRK